MKSLTRVLFLSLALLLTSSFAHAEKDNSASDSEDQIHLLISPVIGYQTLKRDYPYAHNQGMLTYGGRIVVGTYRLAGEFEMQYGSATENFTTTTPAVSTNTSILQARLGVRSIYPLMDELHLVGRVGMEGLHYSNTVTIGPQTTSNSPAWIYEPYVGAGVIFYLFRSLSLSVEEIYVLNTSWETSFGFRLYI